ncbi:MAG: DUF3619 family protein [Burkholderiales bacterium]
MNETQFAHRIRHALGGTPEVDATASARLRAARERALERQKPEAARGLALAGTATGRVGSGRRLWVSIVVPAAILAIAFAATSSWQSRQRAAEIEELDAQLLSSELPIDAYLDQGFATWLKRRASR